MMTHSLLHRQRHSGRGGFTLAELLAVIIIMAILAAVVIPNVAGLTRGASLRGATMQMRATLVQALQNAISRRADVSVLFPETLPSDNPKNYRAYAVYASTYTGKWFAANWEFLPQGIVFRLNNISDTATAPVDGGTTANMRAQIGRAHV